MESIEISFRSLTEDHIPLLRKWLKEPHVKEFWQETENEEELREKFLVKLPERGVRPYVVYFDDQPIGYIQDYEACLVGGGWWPDEKPGVFGVDQFIGDPNFINKGFGTMLISQFVGQLFENQAVREIITDPDPRNTRAIRVYEKVGFVRVGEIKTPGGDALLMRLVRK